MLPESTRRLVRIVLPLIALGIIVAGLWPQPAAEPTDAERVEALASNIRCPFCGGEAIADAPSQIARDLEVIIAEQVAGGATDAEVYAYFESRYGEAALIDPPLLGWGWVLWVGPLLVLVVGGYAIARRRRAQRVMPALDVAPDLERRRIDDQLAQIEVDLAELDQQVAAGEIDDSTRFDLAAAYAAEAAPLRARLAALDEPAGTPAAERPIDRPSAVDESVDPAAEGSIVPADEADEPSPATRDRRRAYAGAAALLVGVFAVTLAVVRIADDGPRTIDVPTAAPIDLENVTLAELENVVERNPDIVGMRLALAQLYMQEGDVQRAAVHFGEVLERERHPEALAWLGFISSQVGELDTARSYLEEALEIEPRYPQAEWWLANVLFYGFETPDEAVPHLVILLDYDDLPDDVRRDAQAMLDAAGGA